MGVETETSLLPPLEPAFSAALEFALNGRYRTSYGKTVPSRSLIFWTRYDVLLLKELIKSHPEIIHDIMQMQWLESQEAIQELREELIITDQENRMKRLSTPLLTWNNSASIWKINNISKPEDSNPLVLQTPKGSAYFEEAWPPRELSTSGLGTDLVDDWPYWSVLPADYGHFLLPADETYNICASPYLFNQCESLGDNNASASFRTPAADPEANHNTEPIRSSPNPIESIGSHLLSFQGDALGSAPLLQDHTGIVNTEENTFDPNHVGNVYNAYFTGFDNCEEATSTDVSFPWLHDSMENYGEDFCAFNNFETSSSEEEDEENPSPIIEVRGEKYYTYNNVRKKGTKGGYFCVFCNGNNEPEHICKSHPIRANGRIVCPSLRTHVCALCQATGDSAHTIKYCPQNKRGFFAMKAMQRAMNIAGSPNLHMEHLDIHTTSTKSNKTTLPDSALQPAFSVQDKVTPRLKRRAETDENNNSSNAIFKTKPKKTRRPQPLLHEFIRLIDS